jgi:hypothetical protein
MIVSQTIPLVKGFQGPAIIASNLSWTVYSNQIMAVVMVAHEARLP